MGVARVAFFRFFRRAGGVLAIAMALAGASGSGVAADGITAISAQSRVAAVQQGQTARAYGFIDFIAREDPPSGHAYVRYGRFDGRGRPVALRYAGLYPRYGWAGKIAGGFIPIDSDTGRHHEDTDNRTLVSFRRPLTREEYRIVDEQVRKTQTNPAHWHALFFNCNEYVGTLARSIGMHAGLSSWLPSPAYIASMKSMNGF